MALLTAYATWNAGGEAPGSAWETLAYPAWSPANGFDWRIGSNSGSQAVCGWPLSGNAYPNADGVGKWGGALDDEADPDPDGTCYITFQDQATNEFQAAAGTAEFFFSPHWDPAQETVAHSLFSLNRSGGLDDGLHIVFNGDGTMTTRMTTQPIWDNEDPANVIGGLVDLGHNWAATSLDIGIFNHIAVVWDSAGIYTYANGVKVGETVYSGPDPAKANFDPGWMGLFLGTKHSTTALQSEGMWDSMAIWNEARYSGPDYTVPTEEIPEPATLSLLGLGGLLALYRRRK